MAPDYTCLLCTTLHPDSLDARIFALRIADSSTFHALQWLVHLCGTLCPFISRTAIWLLQLSCAILSLISFLSTDFVLISYWARLGCDHINALYKFTIATTTITGVWRTDRRKDRHLATSRGKNATKRNVIFCLVRYWNSSLRDTYLY